MPRTIELPPELSLQLARITVPARARPVLRSDEPVRREVPAEPVRGEPVRSDVPDEPVRGEVPAEAMGTEPPSGPRQSEGPAEPVRTEEPRRREPLVEPVPAEPLIEPAAAVPVAEPVPAEPLIEPAAAVPVVEPVPAELSIGPVPVEPVVEPVPAEPVVGLVPVEPLVEAVPAESPVEPVPAESPAGLAPAEPPAGAVGPESPVGPVRANLPAELETAPPLHLVDDPSPPDTLAPEEEPEPFSPPEALTVVPGTGGNPADAVRLAKDMARRHGLRIRGFETAGLETEVVHQIAAALNDLLGKYTVELYGIEVTEQRDDTIRRERKKAAESGSAEPPPVWITLERAELAGPGAVGSGPARRRFRRSGATGRPAYTAVVRAFAAALDEAGDYRARQEAWRILLAGSLSGGPDIGAGLLDPGRALVEGFVEAELHGKRAGEPARELHRALLKMAQVESEESTA
ncbi:hypothetical protein [Nocardia sp. NPDC002869]|uniref:hypothetical protein n=1 Tax=Nocardia sp. NPDC002869 TaxID=3161032 RepID=UPI00398C9B1C